MYDKSECRREGKCQCQESPDTHGEEEERDRDELPSAGDLSSTISAALADSSALVVICSPSSARNCSYNCFCKCIAVASLNR